MLLSSQVSVPIITSGRTESIKFRSSAVLPTMEWKLILTNLSGLLLNLSCLLALVGVDAWIGLKGRSGEGGGIVELLVDEAEASAENSRFRECRSKETLL